MDTSTIMPEVVEDAMGLTDTHEQIVLLYRRRLARLLQLQPTDDETLSHAEQRRLIGRSVMTTIETLSAMGDGEAATRTLRMARQGMAAA